MTDTLYNEITDLINRHEAKGVDREDMYLVMKLEHKQEILDLVSRHPTQLDRINGVKIWAVPRYVEPYIIDSNTIEEMMHKITEDVSLE